MKKTISDKVISTVAREGYHSFQFILQKIEKNVYVFRLYVKGISINSIGLMEHLYELCEKHFKGEYELEMVDIGQESKSIIQKQVVSIPSLSKKLPNHVVKFINGLSSDFIFTLEVFSKKIKVCSNQKYSI